MALNPSTNALMVGRVVAPTSSYPYGSSKDESSPGAGDGTPYFSGRANDIFGMQQALLRAAGIVPNGSADTAPASQYLQAIVELAAGRAWSYDDSGTVNDYVLSLRANQQGPTAYFDGLTVAFTPANPNTGASVINVAGLGGKNIKLPGGADPAAGQISGRTVAIFDALNDWFELANATEGQKGVAEIATQAEVDAGTDDERFVTPLKFMTPFSNSLSLPGFQRLPNGLIIQWGSVSLVTAVPGTVAAVFPVSFPNGALAISIAPTYISGPPSIFVVDGTLSASGVTFRNASGAYGGRLFFTVIGH